MSADELRAKVIAEARAWKGTPWHHMARVKGAGIDCAQYLCAVYESAGIVPHVDLGYYPRDWHLHRDEPRFLQVLAQYADPVKEALPGDIAMFKFGRHAAHGAVVIAWPLIIHAWAHERMVIESDVSVTPALAERFAGFWRLKGLRE